jgi:serine/threonine protein kinase
MQCLHDIHEIVHGDLKTLNVLYFDAGGIYKLCDFGFSKIVSHVSIVSAAKTLSARTGTPFWRAPEMFGRKVISCNV